MVCKSTSQLTVVASLTSTSSARGGSSAGVSASTQLTSSSSASSGGTVASGGASTSLTSSSSSGAGAVGRLKQKLLIEADLDDPEAVRRAKIAVQAQHKADMRAARERPEITQAIVAVIGHHDPAERGLAGLLWQPVGAWLKEHDRKTASLKAIRERLKKLHKTR
jgi:hypothetical protein